RGDAPTILRLPPNRFPLLELPRFQRPSFVDKLLLEKHVVYDVVDGIVEVTFRKTDCKAEYGQRAFDILCCRQRIQQKQAISLITSFTDRESIWPRRLVLAAGMSGAPIL